MESIALPDNPIGLSTARIGSSRCVWFLIPHQVVGKAAGTSG